MAIFYGSHSNCIMANWLIYELIVYNTLISLNEVSNATILLYSDTTNGTLVINPNNPPFYVLTNNTCPFYDHYNYVILPAYYGNYISSSFIYFQLDKSNIRI